MADNRAPPGWWILPAIILSVPGWAKLLRWWLS